MVVTYFAHAHEKSKQVFTKVGLVVDRLKLYSVPLMSPYTHV